MIKLYHLLLILIVLQACNDENPKVEPPSNIDIDSLVFVVNLKVNEHGVVHMTKYLESTLAENIEFLYSDTIVEKRHYISDTLVYKGLYFLGDNNYATYSLDSFFRKDIYFETFYTYDESGYIKEEKHVPGQYYLQDLGLDFDSSEYTVLQYKIWGGNVIIQQLFVKPPNLVSTVVKDFQYSDIPFKYDLINYRNTLTGLPNKNLPSMYGWRDTGPPGLFYEIIRYEYKLRDNLVIRRTDLYVNNNEIIRKEIYYFNYD